MTEGIDIEKIINPNDRGILRVVKYFFHTKTLIILSIYHMGYLYTPILIVFIIDKIKVIKSRFCEKGNMIINE